ncbi:hypothetical protein NDI44_05425 [Trichocoleus sp. DQ-A3]|nr:hypothetical protein [Coleofasciculus sp. FACHB-125]MBD1901115.1 hypothetical protein [Coleofasciculus sp. FACHB-125]
MSQQGKHSHLQGKLCTAIASSENLPKLICRHLAYGATYFSWVKRSQQ